MRWSGEARVKSSTAMSRCCVDCEGSVIGRTSTDVAEASCMRSAQLTAGHSSFTGVRRATAEARPAEEGQPQTLGAGFESGGILQTIYIP